MFEELKRIEKAYSRFIDDSELSKINSKLGTWHSVSYEFFHLLEKAEEFRKKTHGNFDITLKSSLESLGYDKDYSFTRKSPEKNSIFSKLRTMLSGSVRLDKVNHRVLLNKQVEIGGFGKGYCLDRLVQIIESHEIMDYYINAGGDIRARMSHSKDSTNLNSSNVSDGWNILLEHPDDTSSAIGQIKLNNKAIACSAPNRRKWGKSGEYHHLLNAQTKMPQNSVKCIFIIASTGIEADGYATALFAAGFEDAIVMVHELPVDMLIVSRENKMYKTPGFEVEIFS